METFNGESHRHIHIVKALKIVSAKDYLQKDVCQVKNISLRSIIVASFRFVGNDLYPGVNN